MRITIRLVRSSLAHSDPTGYLLLYSFPSVSLCLNPEPTKIVGCLLGRVMDAIANCSQGA